MPDRPSPRARPFAAHAAPLLMALACSLSLPGCYKRVVHADGIGAEGIKVEQSNRSNSLLDRAVFGSDKPDKGKNRPPNYTPKD